MVDRPFWRSKRSKQDSFGLQEHIYTSGFWLGFWTLINANHMWTHLQTHEYVQNMFLIISLAAVYICGTMRTFWSAPLCWVICHLFWETCLRTISAKKNAVGKFYLQQIFVQVIFKIPNKGPNSWAICPIFPRFSSMIFPAIYLHLVRECPFSSGIYPLAATVAMFDWQIIGSYIPLSY